MAGVTFGWIQLTAIAGALQGLLLTAVLAAQRHNRTANRLLAALMAAFTLYLATMLIGCSLMGAAGFFGGEMLLGH